MSDPGNDRRDQELAQAREALGRAWDAWSAVVAGETPGDADALYREIEVCQARIAELGGGGP